MNILAFSDVFVPAIDSQFKSYWPILGGLVGLIFIGLLIRWRGRVKFLRLIGLTFIGFGVIGVLVYLFRYENVLYFSSPTLIYLLGIIFVCVMLWIISNHIIQTPKAKQQHLQVQIKSKYLPKQKKQ